MPNKRQPLTFTELDQVQPRGRGAILRTSEEVEAEQHVLEHEEPTQHDEQTPSPSEEEDESPRVPAQHILHTQGPEKPKKTDNRASVKAIKHASMLAQRSDVIEVIRKAVKVPGREVSFVRLTQEEKSQLADIVYTYKRQGKKTSETEINRIAINFILEDYHTNGDNSILANVLAALLA